MKNIVEWLGNKKQVVFVLFAITSSIELALGILDMCNYELSFKRWLLWGFLGVYFLTCFMNSYSWKEKLVFCILIVMGICLYISSGINTGIKAPIFIYALKGIDRRKLYQCYLGTLAIVTIGVVIAAVFFGVGTMSILDSRGRGFDGVRYSLGFPNPNTLQIVAFWMLVYVLLIYDKEITLPKLVIVAGLYYGVFALTASFTGFAVGSLMLIAVVFVKYIPIQKWSWVIGIGCLVMLSGLLLLSLREATAAKRGAFMNFVNDLISGRMYQLRNHTNDEMYLLPFMSNWKLFSSKLNKNWYDMGYIQIFYYYGIIPACTYLVFVISMIIKAFKKNCVMQNILLAGVCLYLFMESAIFSNYITKDILLILAADVLWKKVEEESVESEYSSALSIVAGEL